jgi:acetyltransferase-like isoleucine patch superfamily enzyme
MNNVGLGVNVIVMKGVTIGDNSVIGANSVVTKNIPANVIAAGNPCKVIREL